MASSQEVRSKIEALATKLAAVEKDIAGAEKWKATKVAEATDKSRRAASARGESTARVYQRQADAARAVSVTEGKKLAKLCERRAALAKTSGQLTKSLHEAEKRERGARLRDERKWRQDQERAELRREADLRAHRQERHFHQREIQDLHEQIAALLKPEPERLRILYATASSEGDLRVAQEIRRVKQGISAALHRDLVEIEHASDITVADLLDYLSSFQPHVVHFSGHANEEVLVFDEGDLEAGHGRQVPIDAFMTALGAPDRPPVLVVLNACHSAAHLRALLGGIPMAIGMSDAVGDVDAIIFATRFYRAVADGQSVGAALDLARMDMRMNGLTDSDLPTLVIAEGLDARDARLVVPPPTASGEALL